MTLRLALCAALLAAGCVEADEVRVGSASGAVSATWTNLVGVSASGNDLTKTNPLNSWNAGAVTVEALERDGYVEFTTGESNTAKMVGLSISDSGQSYTDIDFGLFLKANGTIGVYEAGVVRGENFGTYAAGDLFRIEANDGAVDYAVNGAVFFTSPTAPPVGLRVDTALRTPGATVRDVDLVSAPLAWQNAVGVSLSADGTSLTKTAAGTSWSAGAATVEALGGDGFVEFTTGENNTAKMLGLSNGDAGQHWTDIDFGIYLKANGVIAIAEAGVQKSGFGTYVAGDVFRIEVLGGVARYSVNGGAPFHTSAVAPTFPLLVDTSLSTPGATLQAVELTDGADACPGYEGIGPVCMGSFTVNNSIDLETIAHCVEITGDLHLNAPGMTEIALPRLERVSGYLDISGNFDMTRLRLPALKEVGDQLFLSVAPVTAGIDLSRLRTAGALSISPAAVNPVDVNLGCLQSFDSGFVDGALHAPRLALIGGDMTAYPLDAPALADVAGTHFYTDGTNVPALQHAGAVTLVDPSSIELPALVAIDGTLEAGAVYAPANSCLASSITATSISLPSLERAGAIQVCLPGLTELILPELQVLDPPGPGTRTALFIRSSSMNGPVALPALTQIQGSATLFVEAHMPLLERIAGKAIIGAAASAPALLEVTHILELQAQLSADNLVTVGRALQLRAVTAVSFPSLTSVGGIVAIAPALTTLELPALAAVTDAGTGALVIRKSQLAALSMPALTSVAGYLNVDNNDSLVSLSFPALAALGGFLRIVGNDALPNCYATNLRDQLVAAGWTGTAYISGNNGGGTCP